MEKKVYIRILWVEENPRNKKIRHGVVCGLYDSLALTQKCEKGFGLALTRLGEELRKQGAGDFSYVKVVGI